MVLTSAARINSRLLDKYRGQTVRLTAKVKSVSGDTAQVEAADGGTVSGGSIIPRAALNMEWWLFLIRTLVRGVVRAGQQA